LTSLSGNRISYIAETRSDAWISEQTGIPRSTIGFVRREERTLPKEYSSALRNLYQREAYARLREEGFAYHQARRFSSYAPQSVSLKQSLMKVLIDDLTLGQISKRLQEVGLAITEENIFSIWDDTRGSIVEAMKKSHKDFETVERYLVD